MELMARTRLAAAEKSSGVGLASRSLLMAACVKKCNWGGEGNEYDY